MSPAFRVRLFQAQYEKSQIAYKYQKRMKIIYKHMECITHSFKFFLLDMKNRLLGPWFLNSALSHFPKLVQVLLTFCSRDFSQEYWMKLEEYWMDMNLTRILLYCREATVHKPEGLGVSSRLVKVFSTGVWQR